MIRSRTSRGHLLSRLWLVAGLFLGTGSSLGLADGAGAPPLADLNPAMVTYQHPDQIKWTGSSAGAQQAVLLGDPSKTGLYIVLVKWNPHNMSRPHFHPNDRYITVLSGTWWVGSGTKFDPDATVAMPAGSYVVDLAKQPHYDGAKDEAAIIEIVGEGPATITPAEEK
ncbi:MAG TPA: cupin domain-containing protein [Candidatus Acidoferrales bacterium]|nr:cupin domain-containing protein [Candidatus Acidoferrales bacterium]